MTLAHAEVVKNIKSVVEHNVMTFGTFDILHPGHTEFLKEAKKLGSYLTVVLARDTSVEKIKKRKPHFSERERLSQVKALKFVDAVVLGDENDYLKIPIAQQPDIIALGYDQKIPLPPVYKEYKREEVLEKMLPHTKIVRLTSHYPETFKSSYFRE